MPVQDLDDAFSEHNGPLYLVLGLLSAARRLDRALAPRTTASAKPALDDALNDTPNDPPAAPRDDAPMHAALGLLALREQLLARLARVPARRDPEPPPASTPPLPSELLR